MLRNLGRLRLSVVDGRQDADQPERLASAHNVTDLLRKRNYYGLTRKGGYHLPMHPAGPHISFCAIKVRAVLLYPRSQSRVQLEIGSTTTLQPTGRNHAAMLKPTQYPAPALVPRTTLRANLSSRTEPVIPLWTVCLHRCGGLLGLKGLYRGWDPRLPPVRINSQRRGDYLSLIRPSGEEPGAASWIFIPFLISFAFEF